MIVFKLSVESAIKSYGKPLLICRRTWQETSSLDLFLNGFWKETRMCMSISARFIFQLEVMLQPKDFLFQKFP
jgi:hypothetical protein